ncbi:hypothetical protein BC833DRAFT_648913 [Globomyces pollinis-pini]|nr:hypothetical protein BC833DRAFT_648913 [Globomyces pollinis-pini]
MLQVDEGDDILDSVNSNQNQKNQQKRKKALQASGMEKTITMVEKLPVACCNQCNDLMALGRLHACLHCVYMGCWVKDHIKPHLREKSHNFALDFSQCTLYCLQCHDYIYVPEFQRILNAEKHNLHYVISRIREPYVHRSFASPWIPSATEVGLIQEYSKPGDCTGTQLMLEFIIGIRGLRNMGSTCFMNTILQTILHNPMLKAHFLSDRHSISQCPKDSATCMACQLDKLFTNVLLVSSKCHSSDKSPYTPHTFLYAMWMSQKHMAGYSQQDAHEFFISLLDELHTNCCNQNMQLSSACKCIIHQVFGGLLQSDVTCLECGNVSFTCDPILDISLEIKSTSKSSKKSKKSNPLASLHDDHHDNESTYNLYECLDEYLVLEAYIRYTLPEKLGPGIYQCKSCGTSKEATKQLSFKSLPPVLSIQFKRFEHNTNNSNKIDTQVRVPFKLDMTAHTTRSVKISTLLNRFPGGRRNSIKIGNSVNYDSVSDGIPSYQYSLFAVVCHEGKLDTGHYKAYCKAHGSWFEFDDHNVTQVSQTQVLNANGYMCFYIQDHCHYSPDDTFEGQGEGVSVGMASNGTDSMSIIKEEPQDPTTMFFDSQ